MSNLRFNVLAGNFCGVINITRSKLEEHNVIRKILHIVKCSWYFVFNFTFSSVQKKTIVEYVSRKNQYTKARAVLASVFNERGEEEN